jgi:hypothetical protein
MPWRIESFEDTPNPNALKCWLDRPISDGPVSFRCPADAEDPAADPRLAAVARELFARAGLTSVLFLGDWVSVNKPPEARWRTVRKRVGDVLAAAGDPA